MGGRRIGTLSLAWTTILWAGAFTQAEILYQKDGIQFQASVRVFRYNAYTCNVLEEKHSDEKYEELKANQGRPLHLWQVSYSVYNGTEKGIEYLRAFVDVGSNWPPCDNWDKSSGWNINELPVSEIPQWAGIWGLIQMPHGMRPLQAVQEEKYLLVFHTEQPGIDRWDINYTFDDDPTPSGSRQTRQESPQPRSRQPVPQPEPAPAPAPKPEPAIPEQDRCEGKQHGTPCWRRVDSPSDCHVWFEEFRGTAGTGPGISRVWTGECVDGVAQGQGELKWSTEGREIVEIGHFEKGRREGQWVVADYVGGALWNVAEGPYSGGARTGTWVLKDESGQVTLRVNYSRGETFMQKLFEE